ncbi:MAG: TIM barrel protein [Bacillota bacterium]|nr:TIM barrel protein [Bacillota bacterium]
MKIDNLDRFYIATICSQWESVAKEYGIGLELDHYCQAENMDGDLGHKNEAVIDELLKEYDAGILHAPFNELFPAAIDYKARELAMDRLNQAANKAIELGIKKMVVHSGYIPFVYFPQWHVSRSIEFWTEFLSDKPEDFHISIENVLDDTPQMLVDIVKGIKGNAGICLDVGHAQVASNIPVEDWIETTLPHLSHVHLHNNDGTMDYHQPIDEGVIDIDIVVKRVIGESQASITLETIEIGNSIEYLCQLL